MSHLIADIDTSRQLGRDRRREKLAASPNGGQRTEGCKKIGGRNHVDEQVRPDALEVCKGVCNPFQEISSDDVLRFSAYDVEISVHPSE